MEKKNKTDEVTVVLVDDDQFLRDMYATKFREKGFLVEPFGSVSETLERIRGGLNPQVILFDMVMPGHSGYDLLASLTEEKLAPEAVKIVLSNEGQGADIDKAMELGASGYIVKANSTPSEVVHQVMELAGI